ncbi:hypothetical protein QUB47_23610 [Microcoleus sp. AT9_B5]
MANTKIGGQKIAAGKIGISVEEYQQNVKSGLKWCFSCQDWLKLNLFNQSKMRATAKTTVAEVVVEPSIEKGISLFRSEYANPEGFPRFLAEMATKTKPGTA